MRPLIGAADSHPLSGGAPRRLSSEWSGRRSLRASSPLPPPLIRSPVRQKGYILKGIILGIQKHPWTLLVYFFASFSVLWTLIEGLTHFIPTINIRGVPSLIVVVVIGIFYSICRIRRPSSITFSIAHTNTNIQIKFGDLFCEVGVRCIAVNEFFDSELGLPVSRNSLHGIFLSRCFGGHPDAFDKIISAELEGAQSKTVDRKQGKETRYSIGTTANVAINSDRYLCFALCRTDITTLKAEADIPMLWQALKGLYDKARHSLGGASLVLPLVGSGLSGIGLPARDLLNLVVLSIIAESKKTQIATLVKIILTSDRFDEVDLAEVKKYWR